MRPARLLFAASLLLLGAVRPSGSPTDRFWSLIESARARGGECMSLSARVTDTLAKLPPAAIVEFNEELTARLAESYRWDLWAVASVANDGASDDGFDYFRGWLITRGRARFERAMRDAPLAVEGAPKGDALECEDVLYVARQAYERVAADEIPEPKTEVPDEPRGTRWSEGSIDKVYPGLTARVRAYRR